ncbi:MAG: sodium:alanine symporter family protein [Clostridia bacterium]|nr:sodium:alanine symporter family protein [Clostridia bacterium]
MELINTVLSGYVMPFLLMGTGLFLGAKMRFFYFFHPKKTVSCLTDGTKSGGISPFRALSQALAGTLGVGNMSGVASAICSGGSGAVFWMWVSAAIAMSIKYFEVGLAQKFRRKKQGGYYGGAMYYIKEVFSPLSPRFSHLAGAAFAILCIANSILTGNIVQVNCAAQVFPGFPPLLTGMLIALAVLPVVIGKGEKVSAVTTFLIPFLSGLYIILSLIIIIPSVEKLPSVFADIIKNAFSFQALGGGVGGFLIARAIRFGTTRGIFSNEAGSGTSPTAHAEANAKSPHSQGCFGIFEVFADTIVLCTLTALVILLSDGCREGLSGIALTLYAFSSQAGPFAGYAVGISVILFAYATVICQTRYGTVALSYLTDKKIFYTLYVFAVCGFCVAGTVISEGIMWQSADFIISLMTAINVICLLFAERAGHLNSILEDKITKKCGVDIKGKKLYNCVTKAPSPPKKIRKNDERRTTK